MSRVTQLKGELRFKPQKPPTPEETVLLEARARLGSPFVLDSSHDPGKSRHLFEPQLFRLKILILFLLNEGRQLD